MLSDFLNIPNLAFFTGWMMLVLILAAALCFGWEFVYSRGRAKNFQPPAARNRQT
jgi:hypothetical protein